MIGDVVKKVEMLKSKEKVQESIKNAVTSITSKKSNVKELANKGVAMGTILALIAYAGCVGKINEKKEKK